MIVITTPTGNIGHQLLETIVESGESVRVIVRDPTRLPETMRTRIEVVTEGVLTRMLMADPALEGVAAVLFDEFHERSLNADLGLALCLDARASLGTDLRLVAMSATLDGAAVARLLVDRDGSLLVSALGGPAVVCVLPLPTMLLAA